MPSLSAQSCTDENIRLEKDRIECFFPGIQQTAREKHIVAAVASRIFLVLKDQNGSDFADQVCCRIIMKAPDIFLTHSGTGHADDLLAFSMARILWPDIRLIRTRDFCITEEGIQVLSGRERGFYKNGSFVVADVGSIYDPERFLYDHHQPDSPVRPDGHPYSSAGLFFRHHGHDLLRHLNSDASDEVIHEAFQDIDRAILLPIDLSDNTGCSFFEPETEVKGFMFSDYIALARPGLIASFEDTAMGCAAILRTGFQQYIEASQRGQELKKLGERCGAEVLAVDAFYPSARRYLETTPVRILVHPNPEGRWNARWVKDGLFPAAWRGRIDRELEKATGIRDVVFCHKSGHLAIAKSRDGAMLLAELALRSG